SQKKRAEEMGRTRAGVGNNLGRFAVEFAYLDRFRIIGEGEPIDVTADPITLRRIEETRRAPRPTAAFAAHLGNWEIGALAAARLGVDVSLLYRPPNMRAVADAVLKIRAGCMGTLVPSSFDAPLKLANALQSGSHVAMLVDQHEYRGVDVTFFGRTCKANPLIAMLARHTNCFIRGIRMVRLPD